MQEINLSLSLQLSSEGILNDLFVERNHDGFHGKAVLWWGFDSAHVTGPHECQVQGSRDRGSTQGKDVHELAHLLEGLFLSHSKALFFIDDDQAKILEGDALLDQLVRANDDVDRSGSQLLNDGLCL